MANNPLITTPSTGLTKSVASVSGTPVAGYDDTAGQVKISKNAISVGNISASATTPVTATSGALNQAASPTPANIGGTGVSSLSGDGLVQYSSGIVTTAPVTGSWLQYVSSASAWQAVAYPSTTAPVIANKQEFISNGTWTKPSGINFVRVICMGGGGGGGAGNKGTTADYVSGGNGGGGGGCSDMTFPASLITGSTVSVAVGSGGSGGVFLTSTDAIDGGNTSFGTTGDPWFVMATGGKAGAVGEIIPRLYADGTYAQFAFPLTAKGGLGTLPGGNGGAFPVRGDLQDSSAVNVYNHSAPGGGGGGAGALIIGTSYFKGQSGGAGGEFQGNSATPGGAAGIWTAGTGPVNGSAGGSSLATFGISTIGMAPSYSYFGSGGGGGTTARNSATFFTAGSGGAGGNGGGGGGGGGSAYGTAAFAGGNGGAGGNGWCLILCW
jgi:hypothetical protein